MTRVQLLTPPGRGAIAVVSVQGSNAAEAIDACFLPVGGKSASEQPIGAIRFGKWLHTEGEELLVIRRAEEAYEVQCHGGAAASRAILKSLLAHSCEAGSAADDLANDPRTPLSADAWRALLQASTEKIAAILLDQAAGALEREVQRIVQAITLRDHEGAAERLTRLLSGWRLGEHLIEPWRVVLVGPPNVGKSSLINALVGFERALVYDQPGVTRDVVSVTTAIGGWPVRLSDTAGLRDSADPLESQGVELTKQALRTAEIVVLVHEALDESTDDFVASLEFAKAAVVVTVLSKADLATSPIDRPGVVETSTVGPPGIGGLVEAIERALNVDQPPAGTGVPFRTWHLHWLEMALVELNQDDYERAQASLQSLLAGDQTVAIRQEFRAEG